MLILSRKAQEQIVIKVGTDVITVTVQAIYSDKVRLGVHAADHVQIDRKEVYESKQKEVSAYQNAAAILDEAERRAKQ